MQALRWCSPRLATERTGLQLEQFGGAVDKLCPACQGLIELSEFAKLRVVVGDPHVETCRPLLLAAHRLLRDGETSRGARHAGRSPVAGGVAFLDGVDQGRLDG